MRVNEAFKLIANLMTEKELQQNVIDLATKLGWEHYHTHSSYRSDKGWPDLVLVKPPKIFFVELKDEKRKATLAQQIWLDLLRACGLYTGVWRPSDWLEGRIERLLGWGY